MFLLKVVVKLGHFNNFLIGKELVNKIKNCDKDWGKLVGFNSENVVGIISADIGLEKNATCKASSALIEHRFIMNGFNKDNKYWLKVDSETFKQFNKGYLLDFKKDNIKLSTEIEDIISENLFSYFFIVGEEDKLCAGMFAFADDFFLFFKGKCSILEEEFSPFERIDGIMPLEELKEKSATIIGLGSGGSFIAMELAAAGIGKLHLFDYDRLNRVNLFRHLCGQRDLGRKKVNAVADMIKEHMLPSEVFTYDKNILKDVNELRKVINDADIVVCATDNIKSREMANYLAVLSNTNLVLVSTFDNARIGEIIHVIPGRSACYECTRHKLSEENSLDVFQTNENILPYSSQSTKKEPSQGTRTDIIIVAAMAAKVVIMSLINQSQLKYNYITWGSLRNTEYNNPFKFKNPFQTNYTNYRIHPNCPICGNIPEEIKGIDIEEKYNEIV